MAICAKANSQFGRAMTPEELFTAALGLGRQWRVAECRFEGEPKRLELRLEHVPGEHFECPVSKLLWSARHHRKTLAAYELFPVPL